MSKKNFVTLLLSTVGGILFAIGMCMALLPEWNAFTPGVVMGVIGAVVLLIMVMARRKMSGKSGIIVGIVGIVLLICLIPLCRGLK